MDPYSGRLYNEAEMAELRKADPAKAASLVEVTGKLEDVERISHAVQALNRAERRAAERAERHS